MSATLLTRSSHEKIVEYQYVYERDGEPGCGYSFDCDKDGNITIKDNVHWQSNYDNCVRGVDDNGQKLIDLGIRRDERTVYNPPVYQCSCGSTFVGDGDSKCECGQWYNAGGQMLDAHAMECSAYAQGFDCMCNENKE